MKHIDGKALGLTWFEELSLLDSRETSDLPTHLKRARGRAEKKIAALRGRTMTTRHKAPDEDSEEGPLTAPRHEAPDVAKLRSLAEAATPGPWEATIFDSGHSKFEFEASVCTQDVGDSICRMEGLLRTTDNERYRTDGSLDALYIAAVSPDVVLGLLDRLDRMTDLQDRLRRAESAIGGLAEVAEGSEQTRLRGKLEGVRLALDYLREMT